MLFPTISICFHTLPCRTQFFLLLCHPLLPAKPDQTILKEKPDCEQNRAAKQSAPQCLPVFFPHPPLHIRPVLIQPFSHTRIVWLRNAQIIHADQQTLLVRIPDRYRPIMRHSHCSRVKFKWLVPFVPKLFRKLLNSCPYFHCFLPFLCLFAWTVQAKQSPSVNYPYLRKCLKMLSTAHILSGYFSGTTEMYLFFAHLTGRNSGRQNRQASNTL